MYDTPIAKLVPETSPITCSEQTSVGEVVQILQDNKVGCVIVTHEDDVRGIFTERDIVTKVLKDAAKNWNSEPISKYMTKNPVTIKETHTIFDAIRYMRVGNFRHLAVSSEEKKLVAVISVKDIVNFICDEVS